MILIPLEFINQKQRMQLSPRQKQPFNLTSMQKLIDGKNYRKSFGAISFKKMDIARANTTLQFSSRKTSMGKTFKKFTVRNTPQEVVFNKVNRDIDKKTSHFDEYLSDPIVLTDYKMMSHIGKGCFSTVTLAVHKETGRSYAMKTYEKVDGMEWYRLDSIKRQIKHLKRLQHPNVVRLLSVVKDKKKLQLLMDNGGKQSLSGLLRKNKRFSEQQAKIYMQQIIEAISYCHERGVSHRDIKPENILVNDDGHVTLIDFGFSASSNTKLTTYCGTPPFMCPQITKKVPYSGAAADVWAMGIMLYMLIMGNLPFRATNQAELYRLIQQGKYPKRETFSKSLRNLLDKMLCTDPNNRIGSAHLLSEGWLK